MCWSLLLETYRKNVLFSYLLLNFSPQVWLPVPVHRSTQLKLTVQQALAVAISAVIFSKYSVLSLSLSSSNAIPNLVPWHHLDQFHLYGLSHMWQRVIISILEVWIKCDGNHMNYKGSALPQRNFQVKFSDYMTFWPQREWTI